jgi:hypothetical protein
VSVIEGGATQVGSRQWSFRDAPVVKPVARWDQGQRGGVSRFRQTATANFDTSTHAAAVPSHPFAWASVREGRVLVTIPDTPERRVFLWDEFTTTQDRDLQTFALTVLAAVERFIDGVLDAFEEAGRAIEEERQQARS